MNIKDIERFKPLKGLINQTRSIMRSLFEEHFNDIPHDERRRDLEMKFF